LIRSLIFENQIYTLFRNGLLAILDRRWTRRGPGIPPHQQLFGPTQVTPAPPQAKLARNQAAAAAHEPDRE
jgi:hypothetical protein